MAKGKVVNKKQAASKKAQPKYQNLFESKKRNFRIGNDIQPKRNMTRYVRWPRYIMLQRQKRILLKRLRVPAPINQFKYTLNSKETGDLFKLLDKYKPETAEEKKARLTQMAVDKKDGKTVEVKKPVTLKTGLNHVTNLVEKKAAKLVVIATDVDPIELVVFLPELCRNMDVPFCFVSSKSKLGKLVHLKKTSVVALKDVNKEDAATFAKLVESYRLKFNNNKELNYKGTITLGIKSQHKEIAVKKAEEKEITQRV